MIQSQEGIALQNEILQLQNQVQQLQQGQGGSSNGGSVLGGGGSGGSSGSPGDNGSAPSSDVVSSLLTQVQQLQSQVQDLSGKVDTLQNQVTTQNAQMQQEIGDINFKLTGSATPPGAAPGAAPAVAPAGAVPSAGGTQENSPQSLTGAVPAPPPAAPEAAAPVATGTPAETLKAAEQAYAKGDYATAEAGARSIVSNNGSAPQAYHAQFLLAESLAAQSKPQDAAIAYDDAYNRDRSGTFAAPSLLGLAGSLADISQNSAACDTLASFSSQFPSPTAGQAAKAASIKQRAGCQ